MDSKTTPNQVELYVGVLLLDSTDRVYLIKEDDRNKISKGRWNLPGGAVCPKEDLITAAERTTKLETGYSIESTSLGGNYKCTRDDKEWLYVVFGAKPYPGKRQVKTMSEHVSLGKWFNKEEIIHMDSQDLVHPDMQLVYNLALTGSGVTINAVKFIDYNVQ